MSSPTAVRAGDDAYARYLRGMDASMRAKVALTAAHVLAGGRAADMGMGSGAGSAALAGLYPALDVVGVDLDPALVARASREHVLPNLRFVEGNIVEPVLPPRSMDAIFDSSVLHHVTSFGGYDRGAALRALTVQRDALADGGALIVRDFLDPGEGECILELPTSDGDDVEDPRRASSAALLERHAREHRKLSSAPGFPLERLEGARPGHRRYRLSLRHAVEFVLRKDYRDDWEAEVLEEYTFATQAELEQHFTSLGLRILVSSPLRNPWIVRHRFEGRFRLTDLDDRELDPPATNHVIVGQRVADGDAVGFRDEGPAPPTGFLELSHFVDVRTGALRDLVRRPGVTLDIVPWFETKEGVQVVLRTGVPRPLAISSLATAAPCGSRPPEWQAEPVHARLTDAPLGRTIERALERIGIAPERIVSIEAGTTYYPSPGGLEEEVRSVLVEVVPFTVTAAIDDGSPWRSKGRLVAASAEQLLRAAQVGGLCDARLEINVRALLRRQGRGLGPWIGDVTSIRGDADLSPTSVTALAHRPRRRVFAPGAESAGFLALGARRFSERDRHGASLAEGVLDVVVPARLSSITVVCLPLAMHGGVLHAGLDDDDLPAVQAFTGSSAILVAPAFRLSKEAAGSLRAMHAFSRDRLRSEHGLHVNELFELGARYAPSPGVTPELVYPFGAAVAPERSSRALTWVPLIDLFRAEDALTDGHLRVVVGRAAQMFGLV